MLFNQNAGSPTRKRSPGTVRFPGVLGVPAPPSASVAGGDGGPTGTVVAAAPSSSSMTGEPATMPKVLIIDDDRGPRESLRFILKYDYEVLTASGVREGLVLIEQHRFDVIVLDVRMPERSGIEGLDDIRRLDRDVSIIMFTGYASLEVACEAFRHLANDFVAKPPDTDEILVVVARNVTSSRARRRQSAVSRELEDMNRQLADEIEQSRGLAALGLASDELIHDMNSPLTVLTCCVDLLQMQLSKLPPQPSQQWDEALHYIQQIKNSLSHCLRLSDLWRQIKQNTSGEPTSLELVGFLTENVHALATVAAAAPVDLQLDLTELDGTGLSMEVDQTQMCRVLHNLVTNAIRACQGNPEGSVVVRGRPAGGTACEFEVMDNGCGIPADQAEAIFQPYFSTKGAGRGLGLAICKRIVEDHGGFIGLESKVGVGSTFTVRLPRASL